MDDYVKSFELDPSLYCFKMMTEKALANIISRARDNVQNSDTFKKLT